MGARMIYADSQSTGGTPIVLEDGMPGSPGSPESTLMLRVGDTAVLLDRDEAGVLRRAMARWASDHDGHEVGVLAGGDLPLSLGRADANGLGGKASASHRRPDEPVRLAGGAITMHDGCAISGHKIVGRIELQPGAVLEGFDLRGAEIVLNGPATFRRCIMPSVIV